MARNTHIRGALLEEAVSWLLKQVGYRILTPVDEGVLQGVAGLEIQGRGSRHQIDSLAQYDGTPAFMYPLRLIVEAKCLKNAVGIYVVRNAVGVIKDISENYFSFTSKATRSEIQVQRFNYHAAIFSASGFTKSAQQYAVAHQIFLIDYKDIHAIEPLIDTIKGLDVPRQVLKEAGIVTRIRTTFKSILSEGEWDNQDDFLLHGLFLTVLADQVRSIRGSYFAMLQGRWPIHIVSRTPIPSRLFQNTDVLQCRVWGYVGKTWSFTPLGIPEDSDDYFRLEFKLPTVIGELVARHSSSPLKIAEIKEAYFSYMMLSGEIGGIRRTVRLVLNREWIESYKGKARRRN